MRPIIGLTVGIIIAAILIAASTFLIPLKPGSVPDEFQAATAMNFFMATIASGSALLFYLGLKGFKSAFRRSYALLSIGIILHAISLIALPVVTILMVLINGSFNQQGLERALGVFTDAPYTIGSILMYIGLVWFSKLLGINTWLQKQIIIAATLVTGVLVIWTLLHLNTLGSPDSYFDLLLGLAWIEISYTLLTLIVLWKLRRNAGTAYTRALTWLQAAIFASFVAGGLFISRGLITQFMDETVLYGIVGITYVANAALLLVAGYSFNRITRAAPEQKTEQTGSYDVIVYTASLCSQLQAIDSALDSFRGVTATHQSGQALKPEEINSLVEVYQKLETYLTTQEPLRSFTVQEVRQSIQHRFSPEAWRPFFPDPSA